MKPVTKVVGGLHPNFKFSEFSPTEQAILSNLRPRWYLTNSGADIHIGTSEYRFMLVKPTTQYQLAFGLEREICLLFSPYESFEPRTLDAFDKALKQVSSVRIEPLCRILVSKDPFICEKIASLSAQNPEQPTVVPFTYQDLLNDSDGGSAFNRFRKFFFSRDLFSVQGPLRSDTFFFGRSKLIKELSDRFGSGENSGLFGLRKSGKTSIIYGLIRQSSERDKKIVLIDCESPSVHGLRWYEMLERIVHLYCAQKSSSVKLPPMGRYTSLSAADSFKEDITRIHSSKKAAATLLVLDEIERISPGTGASDHWRNGDDFVLFWQSLRSFLQEKPGILNFLIVGTNPHSVEQSRFGAHDNPLFALVPPLYVPCFNYEQTCEMIETLGAYMGLAFNPSVLAKIQDDFGGHPFLTRQVCSHIHQKMLSDRPVTIDGSVYAEAYKSFVRDGAPYLAMVLDVLRHQYPDEYELLMYLAQGKSAEYDSLSSMCLVNHLEGYGLVDRQLMGPVVSVSAVREYLLSLHRYELEVDSDEKRRDEISSRSSRLEISLRGFVRRGLRFANSEVKALDAILSALPTDRRTKLAGIPYRELLADENCPLFFLDLRNIIERNWDPVFKTVLPVDKARFLVYMDEINEARRIPAHSYAIEQSEFAAWRATMTKLENWIQQMD